MAGSRKLWKTTIVVWTRDNPNGNSLSGLLAEGMITKRESMLVSDPYKQDDGPSEEDFEEG